MSVVTAPQTFPPGTVVKLFQLPFPLPGEVQRIHDGAAIAPAARSNPETWKPALTKVGEPTVNSAGELEVEGTGGGMVLCAALVNSVWNYLIAHGEVSGNVTVATTSTLILAANPLAKGRSIVNAGATNVMYLGLGTPAVLKDGIGPIAVNGSWDGRVSGQLWTGAVYGIAETAAVTAVVAET